MVVEAVESEKVGEGERGRERDATTPLPPTPSIPISISMLAIPSPPSHPHNPPFPINTVPHTALPIPNSTTHTPRHSPTERA